MASETENAERSSDPQGRNEAVVMAGSVRARAEAVAMILELDPETALDDCIESHSIGDTGDYGSSWDARKLKALFRVGNEHDESPFARLSLAAEEMYWEQIGRRSEIEAFQRLVKHLIQQVENDCVEKGERSPLELLKGWCEWKP